jgi:hypothetical protein
MRITFYSRALALAARSAAAFSSNYLIAQIAIAGAPQAWHQALRARSRRSSTIFGAQCDPDISLDYPHPTGFAKFEYNIEISRLFARFESAIFQRKTESERSAGGSKGRHQVPQLVGIAHGIDVVNPLSRERESEH